MQQYTNTEYQVYLTQDTVRGVMLEKARHPGLECIVQMPGVRIGNNFYFDMVADSGINATYEYGMCEKDHVYIDHLATRIAEYYEFPVELLTVSQMHYHPPKYDHFSPGDGPANTKLAQQFGGVVCGIFLVDPEFRMKFWYIDKEGRETPVSYIVDNEAVAEAMPRKSLEKLKRKIELNEEGVSERNRRAEVVRADRREMDWTEEKREKRTVFSILLDLCRKSSKEEESMKMKQREPAVFGSHGNDENTIDIETMSESLRPYTVMIPEEYKTNRYEGLLNGYYISETKTFNVVTDKLVQARTDTCVIGEAYSSESASFCNPDIADGISIVWNDAETVVIVKNEPEAEVIVDYYSLQKDIFSRNQGILESSQMADKQAVIAGVGSGGFFVGLELVKAGIGSVIVADDDCFAYHNICRHVCGIHDVGRFKVDIFKERAADINPDCKVYTFRDLLQHVDPAALEAVLWKNAVILCCTDNRHAGYICNKMADKYHIPMIDAGCGTRASTGEVFYYKPDSGMACYTCAYGEDVGVDHSNQNVRRKFYATENELEKLHFQPGMSLDIELTAIFETKLAIDLLMEGEEGYEPKLLPYINQCTILLNYPVDKDVNPYMQLFEKGGEGKRPLTWKTGPAEKNTGCVYCKGK